MIAMANALQATNPMMAAAQMAAAQQVIAQSQALVMREQHGNALMSPGMMSAAQEKAAAFAAQMNAKAQLAKEAAAEEHFQTQLEINDFPQHARWKVSSA
jgi:ATP-dependent RNA helicase DDX46/PRP5